MPWTNANDFKHDLPLKQELDELNADCSDEMQQTDAAPFGPSRKIVSLVPPFEAGDVPVQPVETPTSSSTSYVSLRATRKRGAASGTAPSEKELDDKRMKKDVESN